MCFYFEEKQLKRKVEREEKYLYRCELEDGVEIVPCKPRSKNVPSSLTLWQL